VAVVRVFRFYIPGRLYDKLPTNGRGQGHVNHLKNLGPHHVSGMGETRTSYLVHRLIVVTGEYKLMQDRLPPKYGVFWVVSPLEILEIS